jgi:hypothetical protein
LRVESRTSLGHETLRGRATRQPKINTHEKILLQRPGQKLRLSHPKAPILLFILNTRDDQIRLCQPALRQQTGSESIIHANFVSGQPTLLEDLDNDQIIRPLKAKIRVFANDLARLVLRDDLAGLVSFSGATDIAVVRGLTWYRSLGGALNFCNITVWTVSANVRS